MHELRASAPSGTVGHDSPKVCGCPHVCEPERKALNAIIDAQFTDMAGPFTPRDGVYT